MSNEWKAVRQQVKAFKNHITTSGGVLKPGAISSYVITKEEIDALLNQRGDGTRLAGIRIYFGAETINGELMPRIFAVGTELVSGSHDDYNIPVSGTDLETASTTTANAAMPLKAATLPCPFSCSKQNILNS